MTEAGFKSEGLSLPGPSLMPDAAHAHTRVTAKHTAPLLRSRLSLSISRWTELTSSPVVAVSRDVYTGGHSDRGAV